MIDLRHFFVFVSVCTFLVPLHAEEQAATDSHGVHHQHDQRQSHIATLVEWFEEQQAYLKYLDNMHGAVEKELNIIKLMSACQQKGAECTGRGIVFAAVPEPAAPRHSPSESADSGYDSEAAAAAAPPAAPPAAPSPNLPTVLAIYRDSALVEHQGRSVLVRTGDRLAGFRVRAIGLDHFELEGAKGIVRLPVYWPLAPLDANPDEAEF